tara:strand:+ start:68 stop:2038 length:1971 start_codon:yes stop_codon:yes gene_type:complete
MVVQNIAYSFYLNFNDLPQNFDDLDEKIQTFDMSTHKLLELNNGENSTSIYNWNPNENLAKKNIKEYWINMLILLSGPDVPSDKKWKMALIKEPLDLYYWLKETGITKDSPDLDARDDYIFLLQALINKNIDPARRSDVFRFFILKQLGGCWIDSTTVLFKNIYDFIEDMNFAVPFMPWENGIDLVFSIDFKNIERARDEKKDANYKKMLTDTQSKGVNVDTLDVVEKDEINPKKIPFKSQSHWKSSVNMKPPDPTQYLSVIPENYFVASTKQHPITVATYHSLKQLWKPIFELAGPSDKLNTKDLSDMIAKYTRSISVGKFFTYKNNLYDTSDEEQYLAPWKLLGGANMTSYLVNYIQLYNAINDYGCRNDSVIGKKKDYEDSFNQYFVNAEKLISDKNIKPDQQTDIESIWKKAHIKEQMNDILDNQCTPSFPYFDKPISPDSPKDIAAPLTQRIRIDGCLDRIYLCDRLDIDNKKILLFTTQYPRFFKNGNWWKTFRPYVGKKLQEHLIESVRTAMKNIIALDPNSKEPEIMFWKSFLIYALHTPNPKETLLQIIPNDFNIPFYKLSGFATDKEKEVAAKMLEILDTRNQVPAASSIPLPPPSEPSPPQTEGGYKRKRKTKKKKNIRKKKTIRKKKIKSKKSIKKKVKKTKKY